LRRPSRRRGQLVLIATALSWFDVSGAARAGDADSSADTAEATHAVDYLTLRANEGGSAGGHAAIRFGAETFHFEHADGLLRLGREDSQRFQHVYRDLENRDIELSRVRVSAETYELLHGAFERRALVQERQLAIEDEIRGDIRLLAALLADPGRTQDARGAENGFDVRGAGFFTEAPGSTAAADPGSRELTALRLRIEAVHGPDFLARRRSEVDHALEVSTAQPVPVDSIELTPDRYPVLSPSFSRRTESLLAARLALELLARPRALRAEALSPAAETLALEPAERERLRATATALRESMVRLVASRREDWGFPLLLGMARLATIETSIASGRWVLLDAFPAAGPTLAITEARRELLPRLLGDARAELAAAHQRFLEGVGFREVEWSALESTVARFTELRSAAAGAPTIRIHVGAMVPEGSARVLALPRPSGDLAVLLEQSQAAAQRYRKRLAALYGYDLVRRNCVSEIFRTLEAALAGENAPAESEALRAFVREESTRRLGGYVHPVEALNFIPFVSSIRVRERWSVAERSLLPSYRHFRLAEMAESEPWLLVALRESNVLTARTHGAADVEGFFVFYTDTQVPLRPLLGALNVGAGLLRSALGLVVLPLDRGQGLLSGLSGVLFSLPELAFQNIRKGYNDYVPPDERPPPG